MAEIHPTAIVEPNVRLADDVAIGPHCVLTSEISIGPGCRLIGNAYINGPLRMGEGNIVYPFCCLGFAPQHAKYDPNEPGRGVEIGGHNTFREGVTVHRAFLDDGPTRIGDHNDFMTTSHVGHDSIVGNHVTMVTGAMLGGHTIIEDRVTIGGNTGIHQFVRVGRGAMLSGGTTLTKDLPPWFMLTGFNIAGSLNVIGMRRNGLSREEIANVRRAYRILARQPMSKEKRLEMLRQRAGEPMIDEYIAFLESSTRGIAQAFGQSKRGNAPAPTRGARIGDGTDDGENGDEGS